LKLMFTCCHPALDPEAQIALTLRTIGGLTTPEIARAFLVKPATMGQRISRAKHKIKNAGIPFGLPDAPDLPARIDTVLQAIYLIYNEGYAATEGTTQMRVYLSEEALFLARLMVDLAPDKEEPTGLLALILFSHARRNARDGGSKAESQTFIPLAEQDRSLWDQTRIAEARDLLSKALKRGRLGPYQLQAAIHGVHCDAPDFDQTDWPQISALYGLLLQVAPSPVVELNHLVALSYVIGPDKTAPKLRALAPRMDGYQPYYAALADIEARQGQRDKAIAAYQTAIKLSLVESEVSYLQRKCAALISQS